MAKVGYIDIAPELQDTYDAILQQRDRFEHGVLQSQRTPFSRAKKADIRSRSILPILKSAWASLTSGQKLVWKSTGAAVGLTSWSLFVSDNSRRLRFSLPLIDEPDPYWQGLTGYIEIGGSATRLLLKQPHPRDGYRIGNVPGRPWAKRPVAVRENFVLPLELFINYKADLTPTGPSQTARFYADVWTSYQGVDIENIVEIPFDPSTDWTYATISNSAIRGTLIGYTLYIQINGYQGTLLFDNIGAVHSGVNWIFDKRCDYINKVYKKGLAIVPPHWEAIDQQDGAVFFSLSPLQL